MFPDLSRNFRAPGEGRGSRVLSGPVQDLWLVHRAVLLPTTQRICHLWRPQPVALGGQFGTHPACPELLGDRVGRSAVPPERAGRTEARPHFALHSRSISPKKKLSTPIDKAPSSNCSEQPIETAVMTGLHRRLADITGGQSHFYSNRKAAVNRKSPRGLSRTSDPQLLRLRNQHMRFENVSM
jgi:hypothetical protein